MRLPSPRGPLSDLLVRALSGDGGVTSHVAPSGDDDFQLSLWMLYELHYRGFEGVDAGLEWNPELLGLRADLERGVESRVRDGCREIVALSEGIGEGAESVPEKLAAITAHDPEVSLPRFLQREADADQYLEFLVQRSLYHLKESDPHAWALPRLDGAAKVALAELLYDEFGGGRPAWLHSRLFGDALESCGLDRSYGAYVDRVPAYTLEVNNVMSLFGLHRRLRGACMGHLAAFEMTSSLPCRRLLQGAERLELPEAVGRYFDEHVEADAVHEQVAARDICANLVAAEPDIEGDLLFGAAAAVWLDDVAGSQMAQTWQQGGSTLLPQIDQAVA